MFKVGDLVRVKAVVWWDGSGEPPDVGTIGKIVSIDPFDTDPYEVESIVDLSRFCYRKCELEPLPHET